MGAVMEALVGALLGTLTYKYVVFFRTGSHFSTFWAIFMAMQ